ncbi:MAG: amino acid adenylation domain-containing protein [Thiomargarita sp.]|nr:amino acid adenylation domain-containing protein [Thiomargarita sp.]
MTIHKTFQNIHCWFEYEVGCYPSSIAVICEDKKITYQELNQRANQLAYHLIENGVKPEQIVGICADKSIEMVIGIIAIFKAGGAYVPLDPINPQGRLSFILHDAGVSILLTQKALAEQFTDFPGQQIFLDDDYSDQNTNNPAIDIKPSNLAYIIYTSGSTGQPKGTMVEHGNVLHLYHSTGPLFGFNETDVWALFHSFAFDVSVWEMWGALLFGGCVVIVPYWLSRSPNAFYQLLCKEQITVLNQTPMAFYHLIETDKVARDNRLNLRYIMIGGEVLNFGHLEPWFHKHGDKVPQLVNLYGLTEVTVNVSAYRLSWDDVGRAICLIGNPIPDVQVYLLDEDKKEVPSGNIGEMYVGGKGIARGYLNRPALTNERFMTGNFGRLYRTGDSARMHADGSLEYLGRLDQQIQIHGFRIEPGEIESIITHYSTVAEGAVIVREDAPGEKCLVAYVVPAHL